MAPAQACQVVQQRLRQDALGGVVHHADGVAALGHLLAVFVEDHRQVAVYRQRRAQGQQDVDLARGVVDVIITADNVGDVHVPVVHYHAEVIGRATVRAGDDQVVQLFVIDLDAAFDRVFPRYRAGQRGLEAYYRLHVGRWLRQGLACLRAPAAVVARFFAAGFLFGAQRFQLFLAAVAVVGVAAGQQLLDHFLVTVKALGLVERAFVVVQTYPVHAVHNGFYRFRGGAFQVGVFDAQHKGAALLAGKCPGEQCRAHAADVQETGGAGGKTGADHGLRLL